ncbi:TetR/AcrR family transcriptional regulator [Hymenobacter sp. 5317J-9]|uniref:TetR/AcrR family transcriptional regulator n=1 Tax=Hymenobacter sp. 5317J-9 TaxID=2932250 RepID=UPI001FD6D6AA|nr:TetR/AcrR family transcriptional regulator [Hymenobacter sp. 5317J-9]UOQ98222.1 TetR/AcrR family transcriptional regulator [Hymenobacter sp. 5317J-9]
MPDFTLPAASLEAAMPVFHRYGLHTATDEVLAAALHTSVPELTAQFPSRELLVHHAILADMERQKREHRELYEQFQTAVERLYGLLQLGLRDLATVPGEFYVDLQTGFPQTWEAVMDHLNSYSAPQLQQLLNDGIRGRLFRSDINIQLVTKILIEQLNLLLNPQVFPPDRYNMREVFRSIFLYYIRGICTDEGARIAAEHFARL